MTPFNISSTPKIIPSVGWLGWSKVKPSTSTPSTNEDIARKKRNLLIQ